MDDTEALEAALAEAPTETAPTTSVAAPATEQRTAQRHAVKWRVLVARKLPGSPVLSGKTTEISWAGGRIALDSNLPVGEVVRIRLTVPPWRGNTELFDLDLEAQVVHSAFAGRLHAFDIGMRILSFLGDGEARLLSVFKRHQDDIPLSALHVIRSR